MASRARVDSTRGSLWFVTWRLAVPVIVSEFLVSSYGFVDLYFYPQWMRFEDMLDPE